MKKVWGTFHLIASTIAFPAGLTSCAYEPNALAPWSLGPAPSGLKYDSSDNRIDPGSDYYETPSGLGESPTPSRAENAFADIARELLNSIEAGKRIALQPFVAAEVPISITTAQSFNDALSRAIEKAGTGAVLVARGELPALLAEQEEFGQTADQVALLEASRADVLLLGTIAPARGGVDISYKAFELKSGRQLASSQPRFVKVDLSAASGVSLEQALASAADALARQAPDMKSVQTLGIYYQQSGVQTVLGSYLGKELTGRLVERISGLEAMPAALLASSLEKVKPLDGGGREQASAQSAPGAFLLGGSIWELGADIEVRLTLTGEGRAASFGVRIRRDSLPGSLLPIVPAGALVDHRQSTDPLGIQLSSDHGRRPVYVIGDAANLVVQTAGDGYLYCFHKASERAGGAITTIFPNAYHADARVQGRSIIHIPDKDMKFVFQVEGPPGVEYVRCFALDKESDGLLATATSRGTLQRSGLSALDDLSRLFRTEPSTRISEATMVMTIVERK